MSESIESAHVERSHESRLLIISVVGCNSFFYKAQKAG